MYEIPQFFLRQAVVALVIVINSVIVDLAK